MKLKWSGIEWANGDKYFYWFDYIANPENRLLGYEGIYYNGWNHMVCFWWFCIMWKV